MHLLMIKAVPRPDLSEILMIPSKAIIFNDLKPSKNSPLPLLGLHSPWNFDLIATRANRYGKTLKCDYRQ